MRAIVFFIFFPIATLAQTNFNSSDMYESNFQLVQREIASVYNPKTTTFTGNKYFYKKPQEAVLVLFDGEELIGERPVTVARKGVGRTFQNLGLFMNLNLIDNLLLGRHLQMKTRFFSGARWCGGAKTE